MRGLRLSFRTLRGGSWDDLVAGEGTFCGAGSNVGVSLMAPWVSSLTLNSFEVDEVSFDGGAACVELAGSSDAAMLGFCSLGFFWTGDLIGDGADEVD